MSRRGYFLVWLAEDGEDGEDCADEVGGCESAHEAAEEFATDLATFDNEGTYGDGSIIDICVRDPDGKATKWRVEVTMSWHCSSHEVTPC